MSLELQADPPATPAAAQPPEPTTATPDRQPDTPAEVPSDGQLAVQFQIHHDIEPTVPAETPPALPDDAGASAPSPEKDPSKSSEIVPHQVKEIDFLIETRLTEPDPPFRAPSSWQVTHPQIGAERQWHWSERSTAAFLGFAAGILIVVPLVIILSMTAEQPLPSATIEVSDAPVAIAQPPAQPFIAASAAPGISIENRSPKVTTPATKPAETSTPISAQPTAPASVDTIQAAADKVRSALAVGQISEARAALRMAASPDNPELWFALAETYDPLVTQGATKPGSDAVPAVASSDKLTAIDVKFAQYYYQQALTHGVRAAQARLAALQKP